MTFDFDIERREAIEAGERARGSLENALNELNSARNWGIYDMLGGGFISSMVKHSKMDKASRYIEEAKADLRSFSRELGDVEGYTNIDLSTGDFWGFADWFFDGLFADWMMQDRINDARRQVQQALSKVNGIIHELKLGR